MTARNSIKHAAAPPTLAVCVPLLEDREPVSLQICLMWARVLGSGSKVMSKVNSVLRAGTV
jgi:hypothetical protein